MKFIISESQYNKFFKGTAALTSVIIQYLDNMMKTATRKTKPKSRNYGNLREDWCKDGKELMSVHYYFDEYDEDGNIRNKDFYNGQIYISQKIINSICKLFNAREKFVLHVIAEWYDENYAQKFAKEMNEPFLHIHDADVLDEEYPCAPEIKIPEDISDDEMIDFIDKFSLYKRDEIIERVNNGEDLKDIYLSVLETLEQNKRYGI